MRKMEKLDKRYLSQNFRTKFIGSEEVRVTQKSEVVYVVHLILLCAVGNASKLKVLSPPVRPKHWCPLTWDLNKFL